MSFLEYKNNVSDPNITGTASETADPGDDLTVDAGVSLTAGAPFPDGNITLTAGDDVFIHGTVAAEASATLAITAGDHDLDRRGLIIVDGDISGGTIQLNALQSITLSGGVSGATLDLTAGSGVSEGAGTIEVNRLQSTAGIRGDVLLGSATNHIEQLGPFAVATGDLVLVDDVGILTIDGDVSADHVSIVNRHVGGTIVHAPVTTVQHLSVSGTSYTLSYEGQVTGPLTDSSDAVDIARELNALPAIGGAVTVVFNTTFDQFDIIFGGALASMHPATIVTSDMNEAFVATDGSRDINAHTIELIADQMDVHIGDLIAQDRIILAPATSGTEVALGNGVSALFSLNNADFIALNAPLVEIGRDSAHNTTAASIHIGNAVVGNAEIDLFAQGAITLDDRLTVLGGGGEIHVTAGGAVRLGTDASHGIDALMVSRSTAGGSFSAVNIGAHWMLAGSISANGVLQVINFGGDLVTAELTSQGGNIRQGAAGVLQLQGDVDAGAGAIGLTAASGGITQPGDRLIGHDLLAQIDTSTPSAGITLDGADNAISGHVVLAAGSGGGDISFTDSLAYMIGGLRQIDYGALGTLDAAYSAAIATSAAGSVTLTAGGDITQGATADDRIVTATLNLVRLGAANPNVTLDNLFNTIDALGLVDLGSGNLKLVDDVATLTIAGTVTANDIAIVDRQAAGVMLLAPSATISGHTIALIADDLRLDDGTVSATDTILLAPFTFGTDVAVGDSISSLFTISQAELQNLSAPTLTIGRDAAGNVTAGSIHLGQARLNGTLELFAQGDIRTETGVFRVNGTLDANAGGMVSLQGLQVSEIGGSAGSHFVAHSARSVSANAITTAGGEIILDSTSGLSVAGALTSHGGNVRLAGDFSLDLDADVDAGSGAIGLTVVHTGINQSAGRLVGHDLLAVAGPGAGGMALTSADNAVSGHVVLGTQTSHGNISFTNSIAYTIGGLSQIDYLSAASLTSSYAAGINTSTDATTTLTAGGDITQATTADDRIVTGTLELARLGGANPNITLDNAFNDIGTLGRVDLGSGAFMLVDTGDLVLVNAVTAGNLVLTTGTLQFRGAGSVTTTGAQTYHADLELRRDTVLTGNDITVDGAVNLDIFDLTANVAGTGTFGGLISGRGGFVKGGIGTVTLSFDETYTGDTVVSGGTLIVDGAIASPRVTVASGATLAGLGAVGAVSVTFGGTLLSVGNADALTTADVTLAAGAHLSIELGNGVSDGLAVHGSVDLGGATLDTTLVGVAHAGDSFAFIDNDGTDAVIGTFAGLVEGALLNIGGVAFSISYHGGDGNDVTLTALANHAPVNTLPAAQSVLQDTDLTIAGLSVADQDAGSGTMTTTLSVAHGTLFVGTIAHSTSGAAVAGNGTDTVTLTGTLAEINATLGGNVTYHSARGFAGLDTLTMTTSDNGNTGLPGPLTDIDTVRIDVTAPVRQPVVPVIGTDGDDSFTAPGGDSAFLGKRGVDSITFGFKLTDATVTYSGNDIIIDGPNASHTVVTGIETFVFTDGTVNNRDGNPLVDDLFYYARNHDVWNAHVDADTHFNLFGWREGRDPNAWFDTKGYLAQYADVKAAGINPLTHYDQLGWREGRDPSRAFDTGDYLSHNTDVAAAHVDPLAHFLMWGGEEARLPFNDGVWG
jgi:autotransporter-associated beta strand protein